MPLEYAGQPFNPQARAVADRQADRTRQTPDRMDGRVYACMYGWAGGWPDRWAWQLHGWAVGQMDWPMGGLMVDGPMVGRREHQVH